MWQNAKALREKKDSLLKQSKDIIEAAKKENRELSPEDNEKVAAIHVEAQKVSDDLKSILNQDAVEAASNEDRAIGNNAEKAIPQKDLRGYSIMKAIREMKNGKLSGLEKEVNDEMAKINGKEARGFYLPLNLPYEHRDLTLTAGAGAKAGTFVDANNFADLLRNKMLVSSLGAKMIDGLQGDFQIPKQTGAGSAYWVTEGNAVTESAQTIGQVSFAPSTVGAFTDLTRKFILQSSIGAEAFVRNDLAQVLAIELDRIAYKGSGSGAEPEGILTNTSCPTVALGTHGAVPTFAKMVELETVVAASNADIGSLAYVTSAYGRGVLKTTPIVSNEPKMIWDANEVNGYAAYASQQMPHNLTKGNGVDLSAVIYGNWADVIYAFWSGVDVVVDYSTLSSSGGVRVVVLQDCDLQLRHPESFAKIVDLYTAESTTTS